MRPRIFVGSSREAIESEIGDVLFVVANLALKLGYDPEKALTSTNAKFVRRFSRVEELLGQQGKTPQRSNLSEMDAMWDQAKAEGL